MSSETIYLFKGTRYSDWRVRFVEFVKDSQDIGKDLILDWDANSCASWFCDMVEAITGENPHDAPVFQGYDSPEGAAKAILKAGFKTLDELVSAYFPEIPAAFVIPGDAVLVPAVLEGDISKVMPNSLAVADPPYYRIVDPRGLCTGPLFEGKRFFAVGRTPPCLLQ